MPNQNKCDHIFCTAVRVHAFDIRNAARITQFEDTVDLLTELQQHRAEKHERRWRKISEQMELLTTPCQVSDGKQIESFDCFEGQEEIVIKHIGGIDAKWWRPQLTDLPEGE